MTRTKYTYSQDSLWKLASVAGPKVPLDTSSQGGTGSTVVLAPTAVDTNWQRAAIPLTSTGRRQHPSTHQFDTRVHDGTCGRYEYVHFRDAWGQPLIAVDPLHDTTTITPDDVRNPYVVANAAGGHDEYEFDQVGRLTLAQPAGGLETNYAYGVFSQLDSTYGPHLPRLEYYLHATNGRVDSSKVNGAQRTTFTYDSWNRLTEVQDTAGHSWQYYYDDSTTTTMAKPTRRVVQLERARLGENVRWRGARLHGATRRFARSLSGRLRVLRPHESASCFA